MSGLVNTLFRTVILDDTAFQDWRERPNLFLRGIVLIIVVSLVAGLISFAVDLVGNVRPVNMDEIEDSVRESFEQQFRWNPGWQDPEVREMMEEMIAVIIPMVKELVQIQAPLPHGLAGLFESVGGWLSRAVSAIGGWLFYGALVLIVVNLLGGSAKLPDFLGTVSLYVMPGLLGLLGPIPCLGGIAGLIGAVWSIVVYVKAVSVATDLDIGKSILAVFAPFVVLLLLGILLAVLAAIWIAIIF
jgi:hypothetical protein